ncbi:tyrosine-type recombinase/integrase [Pseudostreptobacillus hongkongensis]|uniref:tyrosine-type recombinase/integrase n=1 Tax=Pseudostreptobacillus hongkongensis TaxID=1162717 RepID=UPI00082E55F1|nr:site-specific integrase [Pseudostreptobacillus hongkongensis]
MKRGNGTGSVVKLSGNRRKPFAVVITTGYEFVGNNKNVTQKRKYLGYFKTQKEANKYLIEFLDNPYDYSNNITLKELYTKWSKESFLNLSELTKKNKNSSFNNLIDLHDKRFIELKTRDYQIVIDKMGDKRGAKTGVKSLISLLYKFALKREIVSKDYSTFLEIGKKVTKIERKIFTEEEIGVLWYNLNKYDLIDTILILIYTGLRIGELLNLKISDINLEEGYLKGGSKTEAGKNRLVPIHPKIKNLIENRIDFNKEYFINGPINKNEKMSYITYFSKFNILMKKLGMKHTIHDTRHTFASLLSNVDANTVSISKLIGHSSYSMTEKIYTHKDKEELRKAIELIK